MSALAEVERVSRLVMTGIVKRLEAQGIVTRTTDPNDARSTTVVLTEAGSGVFDAGRSGSTAFLAHRTAGLDESDPEILARTIPVLVRIAGQG